MPTYDFRCAECDHRFSDFVNIKDKDNYDVLSAVEMQNNFLQVFYL